MIDFIVNLISQHDKRLHILSCFIIVILTSILTNIWFAYSLSLVIGILKEVYDYFHPNHTEDINDIFADFLGATLGLIMIFFILL